MICNLSKIIVCLSVPACIFASATQSDAANPHGSTVAYVYVANTPNPSSTTYSPHQIVAYAADEQGRLTRVPGSPFNEDVLQMAVNGVYLMAAGGNQQVINAYNIQSNGSLTFAAQTNYGADSNGCGGAGQIFFDHTGHSLYVQEYVIDCSNSGTASYAVNVDSGSLSYLGNTITGSHYNNVNPAPFIGNNIYAYAAGPGDCFYYETVGFERNGNGLLTELNADITFNSPVPSPSFSKYVNYLAAADTTRHVAMTEIAADPPGCLGLPVQLGTYKADANGNLTTTSTYENMPTTAIVSPFDLKMAPSGRLLALGGQEGLEVFHFNGTDPITGYTGLLTSDPVNEMFWDNDHHLYAISQMANTLHVFTVTSREYHEAPGSPYTITSPDQVIVQPWPLPWAKQ